jgi:hypothetical protein
MLGAGGCKHKLFEIVLECYGCSAANLVINIIIGGWQHDSQQPDRNMRSNPRRYHWVAHWMLVALHQ